MKPSFYKRRKFAIKWLLFLLRCLGSFSSPKSRWKSKNLRRRKTNFSKRGLALKGLMKNI